MSPTLNAQKGKITPNITWLAPAAITYGTSLSNTQLNATADVAGSFRYTPGAGTVLNAGTQTLSAVFTPSNKSAYTSVTANVSIIVNEASASITLNNLTQTYTGTPRSVTVTTNPSGVPTITTYTGINVNYPTSSTAPVNVGSYSVVSKINSSNYTGVDATGTLVITQTSKIDPVITWANPAAITYGTAINKKQLNATANTAGTFVYVPKTGTVLNAGIQTLTTTFTPKNTSSYNVVSKSVQIVVNKINAIVTLSNLSYTYDGSAKSATVTTNPAGLSYSVTYNGYADVPVNAGSYAVVATITDPNYNGSSSGTLVIDKATPLITWSNPAAIKYGVALNGTQLNATSSIDGIFNYSPAAGTVLHAGTRTLTANFTPTDAINYNAVNGTTVSLVVNKDSIYVRAKDKTRPYGTANPTFDAGYYGGKVKIVVLGSSTAQGVGASDASHKWTYLLNQRLASEYGSATVSMSNLADGTLNTYAILPTGTDNGSRPAVDPNRNITAALALNPQIILINMPSNDVASGFTSTETMNNFATVINTAHAAGVKVILTGTQPRGDIDLTSRQLLQAENQSLLSTYGGDCVNIYDELTDFSDYTIKAIYRATNNVIHLNDAGHNYIYTQIFPFVKAWIEANTTGFVNGDGPASLSGSLNLNTSATINSSVGTYAITAGGSLSSPDYNVYYRPGVLTITTSTSIVNWNTPASIVYGTPLSSQQLNATSPIPGTFDYTPASGTVLNAGTQTLSVTFTPTDQTNYKPVTTSVTLSVNKAPLAVRADDKTRGFGEENPAFTASYLGGNIKIAVLGSSTAAGVGASSYNNSWVGLVTSQLGIDYPYITTSVSNLAIGGYSTYQILPTGTVNPANRPAVDDAHNITAALALNPQIILINLPSNDVASGYTSTETMNNFATVINAAHAAGVKVILTGTQPRGDISLTARQSLQTENQMLLVTYGTDCINIYDELTDFDTYSVKSIYNSGDNIHLNNAGHNYIYTKMYPPLKAWIAANCSGFVNGDGPGSLSGTLDLTTTATADSPAGTYPITASGSLTSPNYEISYEAGVLTVTGQTDVTPTLGLRTSENNSKINGSDIALSAWPNPFSNNMTVQVKSGTNAHATIALYDLNGVLIRQLYNGEIAAGSEKSIQVSGQSLAAGMYVLRLTIGSAVITKKIAVVR